MRFVSCELDKHGAAILAIINEAIVNTTAVYDYTPRPIESMTSWFEVKQRGNYPVIGIEDDDGQLLGFATYGSYRARPAYKYTVEHSVYVRKDQRGRGLGALLMRELIALARSDGYHVMVGGIDAENTGSIAFHEKLGFAYAGAIRQAGYKFGRWLDLTFYQLILDTPAQPAEG
jgi:phosphinothricin acetyltransferase